jgi:hypothetical protein
MTFRASSTGMLVKRLTTSKLMRVSEFCRSAGFNSYMKWSEFFTKASESPVRGLRIL